MIWTRTVSADPSPNPYRWLVPVAQPGEAQR